MYNIGGGTELTNLQLTRMILDKMGFNEDKIEFVNDRAGHDFRYSVDFSRIATELGYKPSKSLESELDVLIQWYSSNETWWRPLRTKTV